MDEMRLNRARFRAWRRGFREADLILGPFADQHAPGFSDEEMTAFEILLDQLDHDLYAWIIGQAPVPEDYACDVLELIQGFRLFAHAAIDPDRRGA